MSNIREIVDFSGEQINVGIDVHLKHWNVTIFHNQVYLRKFQQESNPAVLISHLRHHYPNAHFRVAYEAGFSGFWAHRVFSESGIECLVVNAADVPQTDKGIRAKNDVNDSRRIGSALAGGMLKGIYVPSLSQESDRSLVRYRYRIASDLNRCKSRIKSLLYKFGITIPSTFKKGKWTRAFLVWLKSVRLCFEPGDFTLKRMIGQVEYFQGQLLQISGDLRTMLRSASYAKQSSLLMTVPGIGALTALTLSTELGDVKRFHTFYQLNSFVGLCPTEFSSGNSERIGPLTPRHHSMLRSLLIEAAWVAIRLDPAMLLAYNEYKNRMSSKRAIIRIARKLLNRIYYILLKQQEYEKGIIK